MFKTHFVIIENDKGNLILYKDIKYLLFFMLINL